MGYTPPLVTNHDDRGSMRVLVTNDDGIDSPGLHALAVAVLEEGWTPVVAGPTTDWSGGAAALGPLETPGRADLRAVSLPDLDGVSAHAVSAPPAFIVSLATLGVFGDQIDLVLAGVNQGPNTGSSTLYSATIGAVLSARQRGLSGLALSQLDGRHDGSAQLWSSATDIALPMVRWLADQTEIISLNVNVPNLPVDEIKEARLATLAPKGSIQTLITDQDDHGLSFELAPTTDQVPENSDTALLRAGHTTVSALKGPAVVEGLTLPIDDWM